MNTNNTYPKHINFIEWFTGELINQIAELEKSMGNIKNTELPLPANMCEEEDNPFNIVESIEDIKKRIKYCKNPLELKQLNQKLNILYKKQKCRRR